MQWEDPIASQVREEAEAKKIREAREEMRKRGEFEERPVWVNWVIIIIILCVLGFIFG